MTTVSQSLSVRKPTATAHWATFGAEHGIAWRDDTDHSVWFQADNGAQTLLHDVDRPWLTLFGQVCLVELQALLDSLHGDRYSLIDSRTHHRVAA